MWRERLKEEPGPWGGLFGVAGTKRNPDPTAWFEAAEKGRLVKVQELLSERVDANAKDREGQTALMKAAAKGHAPVVRALLGWQVHVAVNDQDNKGETALMMAAENGHADAVQVLLSYVGIEADLKDDKGQTALTKAKEKGHQDIVELLEKAKAGKK
jgi:ankyrin repeat protein